MEHPESRRRHDTAERLIEFVAAGDEDSFELVWNSLTARDQRTIAAAIIAELGLLRGERGDAGRDFRPAPSAARTRRAA